MVDTSILIAILAKESAHQRLLERLIASEIVLVGAPSVLETVIVMSNRFRTLRMADQDPRFKVQGLLKIIDATIVPFSEDHYEAATSAFLRYGKGRHSAGLNYSDCMSYAVASISGLPLLYVGDDFSQTDIQAA